MATEVLIKVEVICDVASSMLRVEYASSARLDSSKNCFQSAFSNNHWDKRLGKQGFEFVGVGIIEKWSLLNGLSWTYQEKSVESTG